MSNLNLIFGPNSYIKFVFLNRQNSIRLDVQFKISLSELGAIFTNPTLKHHVRGIKFLFLIIIIVNTIRDIESWL